MSKNKMPHMKRELWMGATAVSSAAWTLNALFCSDSLNVEREMNDSDRWLVAMKIAEDLSEMAYDDLMEILTLVGEILISKRDDPSDDYKVTIKGECWNCGEWDVLDDELCKFCADAITSSEEHITTEDINDNSYNTKSKPITLLDIADDLTTPNRSVVPSDCPVDERCHLEMVAAGWRWNGHSYVQFKADIYPSGDVSIVDAGVIYPSGWKCIADGVNSIFNWHQRINN